MPDGGINRFQTSWTPEREDLLRQLWGTTATRVIATRINTALPGIKLTKSSIIGKAARMGLQRLQSGGGRPKGEKKPRKPPELVTAPPAAAYGPIPMGSISATALLLRQQCRFPLGEPGRADFHYCNGTRKEGSTYCAFHYALCWSKPAKKAGEPAWWMQERRARRGVEVSA